MSISACRQFGHVIYHNRTGEANTGIGSVSSCALSGQAAVRPFPDEDLVPVSKSEPALMCVLIPGRLPLFVDLRFKDCLNHGRALCHDLDCPMVSIGAHLPLPAG